MPNSISIWEEVGRCPILSEHDIENVIVQFKSRIKTTTHFGGRVVGPASLTMYRLVSDRTQVGKVNEEFRTLESIKSCAID